MRLSDLLGCQVIDVDGRSIGDVKDVRLVQDGPFVEGFGNALRVEGVLVGKGALGVRLGIARDDVRGPWPLTWVFRRLQRRTRYVEWADVAGNTGDELQLRAGAVLRSVTEIAET